MNNREKFKEAIVKIFDNSKFTTDDAKAVCEKIGFTDSQYKTIYTHVMRHVKVAKGFYAFPADHHFGSGQKTVKVSPAVVKAEKQKTLQSDLDIINDTDAVAQKWEKKAQEAKQSFEKPAVVKKKAVTKVASSTVSLIPKSDPQYVSWGHFKDI